MYAGDCVEAGMKPAGTDWERLASRYASRTMPAEATVRFVKLCEEQHVDIDELIARKHITLTWAL